MKVFYFFLIVLHPSYSVFLLVFSSSHCWASQGPPTSPDIIAKAASSASREASVTLVQKTNLLMTNTALWKKARVGGILSSSLSGATSGKAATVVTVVTAREADHPASFPASVGTWSGIAPWTATAWSPWLVVQLPTYPADGFCLRWK